ncbi:MAG: ABC transporter permease [Chloroflexi bacterium]|nr:ABC transporter permease [Chloroflexota bacterium]
MYRFILRRILWSIPVLFILSLITFFLMHSIPGGPFDTEKQVPKEIKANLERKYRLDQPLWRQYMEYSWGIVRHLDFGPSYASRSRTVNDIIKDHLPVSAQLGALALAIAIGTGVPLGIIAALKQNTYIDYASTFLAILGRSIPSLALGPFLIWIFALKLHLLPVATWETPQHMILPAITLGAAESALLARLTRASMLQVLREDYIRTAWAKGLPRPSIMLRHALKNALIPVITVMGPLFAVIITGTFIVEYIFAIPGLGRYFITSIGNRDYPVIMGTSLLFGFFIIAANLLVDISYAFIDPRIRYQ